MAVFKDIVSKLNEEAFFLMVRSRAEITEHNGCTRWGGREGKNQSFRKKDLLEKRTNKFNPHLMLSIKGI